LNRPIGLFILIAAALTAIAQTPGPAQFAQDLTFVAQELPRRHPNFFFTLSRSEFDAAVQRLQSDYPRLSAPEFYTRLSELVAMARDGHTSISLETSEAQAAGFVRLPIEFRWFSDGIFVTAAPADRPGLNRARLVRIGSTPIDTVAQRLRAVISHENDYFFRYRAASYLRNAGVVRGLGLAPLTGPVTFGLRLESGEEVTAELLPDITPPVSAIDPRDGYFPAALTRSNENYWSEYWPHAGTVYIRWNRFSPMSSRPIDLWAAETLALIDQHPVQTVIMDVRSNPGGNSNLLIPLLLGLAQRMPALRQNPAFAIYGLTDGGTYSSALRAAEYLSVPTVPPEFAVALPGISAIAARLVGEPTGGKPAAFGEVVNFTLPGSRILGQNSTRYWELTPGIPDRDALYPHLPVAVRSTDYFARHDAVLAAAIAHVAEPPAAASGDAVVVNGASFRREHGIAPDSLASAFGVFPAGAVQVSVNGRSARVLASTASQINFLVPAETSVGRAALEIRQDERVIARGEFDVTSAGPGIFVANGALASQPGAILNENFALNTSDTPARRGTVLQIFATGHPPFSAQQQAAVNVWVAERPAQVDYSGPAPGFVGLWQINARVPNEASVAGQVPVYLSAGSLVSNAVTVYIER
jgi:uncharacterized protein (TIGR03437 family)